MKPNKQKIIDEIVLEIEVGKGYSETLAVNGNKWQLAERTFVEYWNKANKSYSLILETRKRTFEQSSTQSYLTALEGGLWSKVERQLKIQKAVEDIENILDSGVTMDFFIMKDKTVKEYERPLMVNEIAAMHRVLIGYSVELSKMSGDYAPDKYEPVKEENKEPFDMHIVDWLQKEVAKRNEIVL